MRPHCITMVIVVLWLREVLCRNFIREEGPFEGHVYNVSNCITEKPWFHTNVTAYTSNGRRLLRGKVVTQKFLKNFKFSIKMYYLEDGKVKALDLKNQNCRNYLIRLILQMLNAPLDMLKCTMKPVIFEFSDLDINAIMHKMVQALWYGTVVARWEIAMPTASFMCLDINLQIRKIHGNMSRHL